MNNSVRRYKIELLTKVTKLNNRVKIDKSNLEFDYLHILTININNIDFKKRRRVSLLSNIDQVI
jgi:hypothetical protein